MSEHNPKDNVDQYGRKTWDVEAYAREAKQGGKPKAAEPSNNEAMAINQDKPTSYLQHRSNLLNESIGAVNKHTLINPLNTKSYGKDKRFGFFCPVCDLSFRDNLALIDHVNSPQHIGRSQQLAKSLKKDGEEEETELLEGGIRRASVEEVIATIEKLVAQLIRAKQDPGSVVSIQDRINKRKAFEQKQLEKRRLKRQNLKKRKRTPVEPEPSSDISNLMGFSGFSTSKK